MIHRLARRHLFRLAQESYGIAQHRDENLFSRLNLNINSLSSDPYRFYPALGVGKLEEAYIRALKVLHADQPFSLRAEQLLFAQGAAEAIDLIIRSFCEPKEDAILITSPTFPYYAYRARLENIQILDAPLLGPCFDRLDVDLILQTKAKVLFLCTPNNPVGSTIRLDELETVVSNFSGIVVVDEAYIEWTEEKTVIEWIERYDNLIVLRSFSKIWGLAGARIGVAIASKQLINTIRLPQTLFSFPDPSRNLALQKLQAVEQLFTDRKEMIKLRCELYDFLISLDCVEKIYPSKANFLLVTFKDPEKVIKRLFLDYILVADVSLQVANSVRISVGSKEEIERLMEVFTTTSRYMSLRG